MGITAYQAAIARDAAARALFVLPHQARRQIYSRLQPKQHQIYREMRTKELGAVPGQSVSLTSFDRHECIFVHIPKCAGISIGQSLFGSYEGNHLPIPVYQLIFSEREFASYYKFSFVRNPWDRLLSAYRYLTQGSERVISATNRTLSELSSDNSDFDLKSAVGTEVRRHDDFEHFVTAWITRENIRVHEHFRPQHRFVCSIDGQLQLDYVARFESIEDDLLKIAERLEIEPSLIHQNRTLGDRESYQDMYTPKMRAIVERHYRKDIEMFGYRFDGEISAGAMARN